MTLEVAPESTSEKKANAKQKNDVVNNNTSENGKNINKKKVKKNNGSDARGRRNERQRNKPKVKCQIAELKDKVFDCSGYKMAEDYKEAKEALESYVASKCKHGTDISNTLEKMKIYQIPDPKLEVIDPKESEVIQEKKKRMNNKRIDALVERENTLETNLNMTYKMVWDMCSDEMHAKLKEVNNFNTEIADNMDVLKLLEEIRKIMYNYQDQRYGQHNVLMAWNKFYDLKQQPHESVLAYYERFKLQVKVLESVGANIGRDDLLLIDSGFETTDPQALFAEMKRVANIAKDKYLAYKFIYDADHKRWATFGLQQRL